MATFEDAYAEATRWLDERGLLLNSQLLQMASGNSALQREVRAALLSDGMAIDRYGVGLLPGEQLLARPAVREDYDDDESDEILFAEAEPFAEVTDVEATNSRHESLLRTSNSNSPVTVQTDWWLMAGGMTRGPFSWETLLQMRQRGEVADTHLIRQGERGAWCSPHDVVGLAEVPQEVSPRPSFKPTLPTLRLKSDEPFAESGRTESESPRHTTEQRRESHNESLPRRAAARGAAFTHDDTAVANEVSGESSRSSVGTSATTEQSGKELGSTRAAPRQLSRLADITFPSNDAKTIARHAWQYTATFVGGELRLQGIVATLVAVFVLALWSRQPPTASTIYREFTQYHAKLDELKTKRVNSTDWKQATARDRQRVQTLLDGLKKRASASRPAEQQLMWAGKLGLVELFKQPSDTVEYERIYTTHMSQAKRLIDGVTAK